MKKEFIDYYSSLNEEDKKYYRYSIQFILCNQTHNLVL
jgi:hypothetical protein